MDRLKMLVDWQEANEPLHMSEKVRLMALSSDDFVAELDRMAEEYHRILDQQSKIYDFFENNMQGEIEEK